MYILIAVLVIWDHINSKWQHFTYVLKTESGMELASLGMLWWSLSTKMLKYWFCLSCVSVFSFGWHYTQWMLKWVSNCVFIFLLDPVQPSLSAWSRGVGVVLQSPRSHRETSVSWSSSTRPTVHSKSCEYQHQCLSHTPTDPSAALLLGGFLTEPLDPSFHTINLLLLKEHWMEME